MIKLEAWWRGYSWDVEEYIKRCKKCKELRNFTQTTLHSWPREVEPWCSVCMDHAYITGVGLLLILVDSFSGWPEIICVPDKKSSTIKQILRVIFSRKGIPKTLNFVMKILIYGWKKIGCKLYKTSPYHPQSNGLVERMVQTLKMGLKACSQQKEKNRSFSTMSAFKHNTTRRKTRKPISFNGKAN